MSSAYEEKPPPPPIRLSSSSSTIHSVNGNGNYRTLMDVKPLPREPEGNSGLSSFGSSFGFGNSKDKKKKKDNKSEFITFI